MKITYAVFLIILVPVYYKKYGLANFLWFSDIALIGTGLALWLESSLLVSMMTIGVIIPELAWNVDYFTRLSTGKRLIGLSDYMFDSGKSYFLRGLSLFHVLLPAIMLYMLHVLGYDNRAFFFQTISTSLVLLMTFLFTRPEENINWVFGPGSKQQEKISSGLYLMLEILLFPLLFIFPAHLILSRLF